MKNTNKITAMMLGAALAVSTVMVGTESIAEARGPMMGGLEMGQGHHHKLFKLMKKLDLRADQRVAVESLVKDMKAKAAPLRKLRKQAMAQAAAGARAGKIDKVAVEALSQQARTQAQALKPDFLTALNKLHAILDQQQRAQLVQLIKEKKQKRGQHFRGKHRNKMQKLAKQLDLTEAQQAQIKTAMMAQFGQFKKDQSAMKGKWQQHRADAQAAAAAFTSDTFDASSLALFNKAPRMGAHKGQRMIAMSDTILPVLTDVQREKLATIIEKRGTRNDK